MAKTKPETAKPITTPFATALFTHYQVRWQFLTRLCASVPADPEIVRKWIEARKPSVKPAGALSIEEINEEVLASIERGDVDAEPQYAMLVFQRHDGQLVMRAATVKAHIKDCARVLSAQFIGKIQGERSFASRVTNGVCLDREVRWFPIQRLDGSPITEADGAYDKPVHARGPRGEPLNALKRIQYIDPPSILEFRVNVLGRSVSHTDLNHLFTYGGFHGYAGERSDGEGRYEYRLSLEEYCAAGANGRRRHRQARTDLRCPRA